MLSRILFFIWLLSLFILIYILVYIANRIVLQLFFADVVNIKSKSMSLKKAYYFGSVFALGPVMMISLQSVGGVGLGSFVLVCFLLILGSLYVSRQAA